MTTAQRVTAIRDRIDGRLRQLLEDNPMITWEDSRWALLRGFYQTAVTRLAFLLPDADVNDIDPGLAGTFSDSFKDENGIRPRFHITYKAVIAWFERVQAERAEHEAGNCGEFCWRCQEDADQKRFDAEQARRADGTETVFSAPVVILQDQDIHPSDDREFILMGQGGGNRGRRFSTAA